MRQTVSDFILDRLGEWGIKRIFGFPGDGINGMFVALERAGDRFELVRVSHEEAAAFMACAHAKFTGEVGVCLATSGPGAIHLLNGLYDAKMDHQPVVAIVGQQSRTSLGGSFQQEVDLTTLYKDVAGEYVHMIADAAAARHVTDRAIRIAKSERTVTCIILPNDVQELAAVESPPREHGSTFSGVGVSTPRVIPTEGDLAQAAQILNEGERVAMLVGAGALGAEAEVLEIADVLGAGIAKALLGKAVVPDTLPHVTGSIGLLGTRPSYEMMMQCDTLLMVGSSFPYSEFLPRQGAARGVQIDIDPRMIGLRYPMEMNLVGDAKESLRSLLPFLRRKEDRSWRGQIERNVAESWKVLEARAMTEANPINPERVFWELSSRLPDRCILTSDSGTSATWWARDLRIRSGMMATLSGNLATMCPGVPYAIAAKFAHPDRVVIAAVGDGAMQMLGINDLITISRYWKDWADPRLIVLVLNNGDLNMVTWEMRVFTGNPKYEASQLVPPFPYAGYAELLGLKGIRVEDPERLGAAWDQALAADRPVVLEAVVDPDVPPLPPHLTLEQAREFTAMLVRGDPDRAGIIRQTVREVVGTIKGKISG